MNVHDLILQTKDNPDLLTIEATVSTGFEFLAQDECREKCKPTSIAKTKGRIFFNIPTADFDKVLTLRSVDNVFLVTETIKEVSFEENKDNDLNIVKSFVEVVNWENALSKWQNIFGFNGIIYPSKNEVVKSLEGGSGETANMNKPLEIGSSENIISESGGVNISAISISDDNKSADTDVIMEKVKDLDRTDTVEFEEILKTNLKTDFINLEDNSRVSSSGFNRVHDLVPNNDIVKKANDDSSSSHEVKLADSSNTVVQGSENLKSVKEGFVCDDMEQKKVEHVDNQDDFQGSNVGGIDKSSTTLVDGNSGNKKKPPRGRNMETRRNNEKIRARPRGKRLQRISNQNNPEENTGILKFRATCYRVGGKHSFSSMEAACEFGGTLQDKFGWTVDLTQFDLNVILNIEKNQVYICIALTNESLHRRNITHFSNTTMRATMCYNLLRLAEPMTGEIVIDPLCGGGSIPIEGSLSFPNTYHICGDYNEKAVERTRANIQHNCKTKTELKVGAVKWNVKSLPLRAQSVDVLVSDLPFGRRSGSKQDNQRLYSSVLFELAKVVRTGTGRACLLTYDRTGLTRALRSQSAYWREIRQFGVNQGGLFSTVFLLLRRASPVIENTNQASVTNVTTQSSLLEDNSVKKEEKFEDITLQQNDDSSKIAHEKNGAENMVTTPSVYCEESALVLSVEVANIALENQHCSEKVDQLSNENITKV